MTTGTGVEDPLRGLAPQVLGVLIRRHGRFDACEDAVQEALLAAAVQWRAEGVPESPRGWLITVASRRLADAVRSDAARRRREDAAATLAPEDAAAAPAPGDESPAEEDDTLTLLLLCCHPALSPASQPALTLRAVGGLTTAEIAHALLVPEATMAQRISRAKQRIKAAGARFELPAGAERTERLRVVLHVLYLMFNEGHRVPPARLQSQIQGALAERGERTGTSERQRPPWTEAVGAERSRADHLCRAGAHGARARARARPGRYAIDIGCQATEGWCHATPWVTSPTQMARRECPASAKQHQSRGGERSCLSAPS